MAIETTCGGCGKLLSVGDEHAGRRARCPACGQVYMIPGGASSGPLDANAPISAAPSSELPVSGTPDAAAFNSPPSLPSEPASAPASQPAPNMNQFWMRSTEGVEYGPVDRETLDRWFREGRVGPGYMIRQSETGMWQSAEFAKPLTGPTAAARSGSAAYGGAAYNTAASNPYAAGGGQATDMYRQMYAKPDQSGMVLAFGILSWFICPIFGIVAWIMGRTALKDIATGLMDPANKGLIQAGYYLGIVNVLLYSMCFGGYIVFAALAIGFGGMR